MADLEHLNELYGESEDPWHMRGGWSAQRRRDLLLASLNHARYGNTFVPGCGSGELIPALARRTDRVLAADDNRERLVSARARTEHLSNVEVQWLQLPAQWPTEARFDLIVLHEMGYLMELCRLGAAGRGGPRQPGTGRHRARLPSPSPVQQPAA